MSNIDSVKTYYSSILRRTATDSEAAAWAAPVTAGILSLEQVRTAIIGSTEGARVQQVLRLYQVAFNRVADSTGLTNWVNSSLTIDQIAAQFTTSAEFTTTYGTTSTGTASDAFLTAVYQNALGRSPDSAGLASWKSSGFSLSKILTGFSESTEGKSTASSSVTNFLNKAGLGTAVYSGTLFSNSSTTVGGGTTYALTTATDTVTGTANADTITGYVDLTGTTDTFTAADTVDGAGGTDTFSIVLDGTNTAGALPAASISNVEVFKIKETGGTAGVYNFASIIGETSVVNNVSTDDVTFSTLATGTTLTITGDAGSTNGATIFTMAGATDAVSLTFTGGTTAGNVTRNQTGAASVTINSTGGANYAGTIDLDTATLLTGLTINATTNLAVALAADYATGSTLTVSGAATNVDVTGSTISSGVVTQGSTAISANFSTVNASGLTAGGLSAVLGSLVTVAVTGGAGNDFITTGAVLTTGSVAAGAGTADKLAVADSTHLASATLGAKYTGFEIIQANNGVAVDLDHLSGITGFFLNDAGGTTSLTNLTATAGANGTIMALNSAATLGIKSASTVGTSDTFTIAVTDGDTTTSEAIASGDLTIAGVETINITATDDLTLTTMTNITGLATMTVSGVGDVSLTTGAMTLGTNVAFNLSGLTAAATFNAGAATTAIAITGGAGADTITGSTGGDAISGGAGADTISNRLTGGAASAGDAITTGAGFDTVVLRGSSASSTVYTGSSNITDFTVGTTSTNTDLIAFSSADTDYSAGLSVDGTAAGASGTVGVLTLATGATAAGTDAATEFVQLTTGVAFTTNLQSTFNAAIGSGTVTGLTDGIYAASFYDTTNSKMVIVAVDTTTSTAGSMNTGDTVALIGTIDMTAANYALIDTDNFAAFIA